MKQIRKILSILSVLALIAGLVNVNVANAASIVTLSDTMTNQTASAVSNHTIAFTLSAAGALAPSNTITVTFPAGFDLTSIVEDDLDIVGSTFGEFTTAADCTGSENMSAAVSGQVITFTLCAGDGGTLANSETVTVEIGTNATASGTGANQIVNHATPGSYAIAIDTTADDASSLAIPIISNGDVTVTATVDPSITFVIRTAADDGDTNSCALGTLTTGSVSTCGYRLAVDTNATSGYSIYIKADGLLNNATDNIDDIAENGTVASGTEGHGIAVTGATAGGAGGATYTEAGDFNDDDTPVPTATTQLFSIDKPADYTVSTLTTSTLVTHRAAISAVTPAGAYNQVVTYTVVGNF